MGQKFGEFCESYKSLKHDLGSFKDPVCYMCLIGAVIASWSLTQEVTGSSPFIVMTNIFVTELKCTCREKSKQCGNLLCRPGQEYLLLLHLKTSQR